MVKLKSAPQEKPTERVEFPIRVACIDNGSNAIRFLVAEFSSASVYQVIETQRAPVRMGHGVFISGRLLPKAIDDAVEAITSFRERMDAHGISHYRAVATSAVREASNAEDFLSRVKSEAGLDLETITGSEEARLVHTAIKSRIHLDAHPWVLADLGGGSVEVSLVDDTGILWSESHTMGSVRLLEELSDSDQDAGRFRRVLSEYISTLKIPSPARGEKPRGFIATGGNIESLAKLTGVDPADTGVLVITLAQLRNVIDQLTQFSFRERMENLGLRQDRADVIIPAALVYERLAVLADVDRIHVPQVGVKEGVLIDLVDDLSGHHRYEERLEESVLAAAMNLGRRYVFDENHATQVCRLAESLFDQTQPLHKLAFADRRILLAAALLHDIGGYISRKKHHHHSEYLIRHCELSGLSPREIKMVAALARFHRKSDPSPDHAAMQGFDALEQGRVTAMAALLRLADVMDREHKHRVTEVRVQIKKAVVTLSLETDGEMLLERMRFKKRAQLFVKTFGHRVKVKTEAGGPVQIG